MVGSINCYRRWFDVIDNKGSPKQQRIDALTVRHSSEVVGVRAPEIKQKGGSRRFFGVLARSAVGDETYIIDFDVQKADIGGKWHLCYKSILVGCLISSAREFHRSNEEGETLTVLIIVRDHMAGVCNDKGGGGNDKRWQLSQGLYVV